MFEMYHASRQSFRFLKQFYIGEVRPSDRERVCLAAFKSGEPTFLPMCDSA